jgi:hypothetical protein
MALTTYYHYLLSNNNIIRVIMAFFIKGPIKVLFKALMMVLVY